MELEGECESGRMGRSGEGWKPKSERRLEERKGKMRERRKNGGEGKEARGEEEKEASRSVQFNDRSSHFNPEQTEDSLRPLFVFFKKMCQYQNDKYQPLSAKNIHVFLGLVQLPSSFPH